MKVSQSMLSLADIKDDLSIGIMQNNLRVDIKNDLSVGIMQNNLRADIKNDLSVGIMQNNLRADNRLVCWYKYHAKTI